jgi:hypothetical protein
MAELAKVTIRTGLAHTECKSPSAQSREVLMCMLQRERATDKCDLFRIGREGRVVIVHWPFLLVSIYTYNGPITYVLQLPARLTPLKLQTRPEASTKWRP